MKLFGTDGIRGEVGKFPMRAKDVQKIGAAFGTILSKQKNPGRVKKPSVVVLKDTRESGHELQSALVYGLCNTGIDVLVAGVLPTPAAVHLINKYDSSAAIVLSASHNPFNFNGLKFFNKDGFKLSDDVEKEIESLVASESVPKCSSPGKAYVLQGSEESYKNFLKNSINNVSLSGIKLVIDCANGAAYRVTSVFEELGAESIIMANKPDGKNINKNCGAVHPQNLKSLVLKNKADAGICFDGDADRVIMLDEEGNLVDGDQILSIFASNLPVKNKKVAITVMSNIGLKDFLKERGIGIVETKVGDINVVKAMRQHGLNLGGEQSGHIVLFDYATTGDGLLTALQVIKILKSKNVKFSKLINMKKFPQKLINIKVREKKPFNNIPGLNEKIEYYRRVLGDSGRILVRYSGTEDIVRVMVEGKNEARISEICRDIAGLFQQTKSVDI